jgi:hypothetical protein
MYNECTNSGHLVTLAAKFCMMVPNNFSISLTNKSMYQFNALSTKCHITVTLTGHSGIVGPKCETCLGSSCQHKQFVGSFQIFSKFVYPCQLGYKKLQNTNSKYIKYP